MNPASPPSGSGGGTSVSLQLGTSGDGIIRGTGSDCRGSCTVQMASGAQLQLQAIPDSGVSFNGWSGACSGNPTGCEITVNGDTAVAAAFARPGPVQMPPPAIGRQLSVVVEGSGRVVSSPAGVDCDSTTCQGNFADGARVSLTATPAAGFLFSGWGGSSCTGPDSCALTLGSDAEVFALFRADPGGTAFIGVDVNDDSNWAGTRVDDGAVYYFRAGSLLKRLK